ncbi:MAG: ribosome maturation factor RimP [Rhodospirillaceae bacterium]|nr:ribosome maturation factor RimP [Rhodospirillaceae bacterium]
MPDALEMRIAALITPSIEAMGYELVRADLRSGRRRILQIMVERADRIEMTVDDCASVSRAISALLDVEDPIRGTYNLEVSSPGIDRPLVRLSDYDRFSGFEAKIELEQPVDGRKRLRGTLLGVNKDETVTINLQGDGFSFPYSLIRAAKLVLTEDLISASQAGRL